MFLYDCVKMKRGKKHIVAVLIIVAIVSSLLYLSHTNRAFFQGDSVSRLPDRHIRNRDISSDYLELMFRRHGGVYFNHSGTEILVNVAFFERDSLILHERVTSITASDDDEFSGYVIWGLTTERNLLSELRVNLRTNRGLSQNYFDFSLLDFEPQLIWGSGVTSGMIEHDRRYIMEVWTSGNTISPDGNAFNPSILRENGNTAILYIVFK